MSEEIKFRVLIRNNETGEVRGRCQDVYWNRFKDKEEAIIRLTKGGMSCDCSRYLHFQWAENIDVPFGDPRFKCSDGKFSVLSAVLDDGRVIILEDENE